MKFMRPTLCAALAAAMVFPAAGLAAKAKWARNVRLSSDLRFGYNQENLSGGSADTTAFDIINANLFLNAKSSYKSSLYLNLAYDTTSHKLGLDEGVMKFKNAFGSPLNFSLGKAFLPIGSHVDRYAPHQGLNQMITQSKEVMFELGFKDARGFDFDAYMYKDPQHDDNESNVNKFGIRLGYQNNLAQNPFSLSATYIDDARALDGLHTGTFADITTAVKTAAYDYELNFSCGALEFGGEFLQFDKALKAADANTRPKITSGYINYLLSDSRYQPQVKINFEQAEDASSVIDYKRRWGGALSFDLAKYATASLEVNRYKGFASADSKNTLVASVELKY